MRVLGLAAGVALMCAMASPVMAADMAVKAAPKAPPQQACLRWIEQTYSWYNYCDPMPYYGRGRNKYVWKGGPPFNN